MQTLQANPRHIVERALTDAPDPVIEVLAKVYDASTYAGAGRTVIVRFTGNGQTTIETLTTAPETIDPPRPMSLLEAFQAMGQPYLDALERGREARKQLLAAEGGVMSAAVVAEHLGITRQAVDKRRRAGRLLGVTTGKRGYVFPAWQFSEDGMLPGFEEVQAALSDHNPWSQMIFWLTENMYVDELLPLHVLRRGDIDRVRRAARGYLEHGAA